MKMVPNSANHPRAGRDDPDRSGVWGVAADIPYISGSGGSVPDVQFTDESQLHGRVSDGEGGKVGGYYSHTRKCCRRGYNGERGEGNNR